MIDYDILPTHMRESARAYIETGRPPGNFLAAVLENNLHLAAGHADEMNRKALYYWAMWLTSIPLFAWGEPEKVKLWQSHKGLEGLEDE